MVSGVLPFQAGTPMALLSKQLNEAPPILTDVTDHISPEFAELVNRMLVKDPEERITLDKMIEGFQALQKIF